MADQKRQLSVPARRCGNAGIPHAPHAPDHVEEPYRGDAMHPYVPADACIRLLCQCCEFAEYPLQGHNGTVERSEAWQELECQRPLDACYMQGWRSSMQIMCKNAPSPTGHLPLKCVVIVIFLWRSGTYISDTSDSIRPKQRKERRKCIFGCCSVFCTFWHSTVIRSEKGNKE